MSKQYLIDEDTLKELLFNSHQREILARDNVDNWWGYMKARTQYLAECASMLPWNEGRSIEDLMTQIEKEYYYIDDLVDDQINAFWEEYDNHKPVDDEIVYANWTGMDGDQCSHCGRSLRDLMDGDSCYSSEFENTGFDQLKACPFCGAKIIK